MKNIIFLFALLLTHPIFGLHVGAGFSWNTIDETFDSKLHTNENRSGKDRYETSKNRLAPVIQLGHRFCLCDDWIIGILAQWKYLNYKTPNVNSSRGQILPNATFSSINIFGPDVKRDFTSKTRLNNEVMLLGYLGKEVMKGYAYLGLGPAFFTASNSVYVSSVHVPNGVGDHLISTSVTRHKTIWGGAAQAGYQYCLNPCSFINISYTYLQSGRYRFNNSANAAILNGANNPGPTTLFLKRALQFSVQEFTCSMNLVF
jgi:outer membrane protein W